jgi:hypothetical protein
VTALEADVRKRRQRRGRASQAGAEAIAGPGRVASLLFIPQGRGWVAGSATLQRKPALRA